MISYGKVICWHKFHTFCLFQVSCKKLHLKISIIWFIQILWYKKWNKRILGFWLEFWNFFFFHPFIKNFAMQSGFHFGRGVKKKSMNQIKSIHSILILITIYDSQSLYFFCLLGVQFLSYRPCFVLPFFLHYFQIWKHQASKNLVL